MNLSITYNEILEKMELAFFNESGQSIKNMSDLELRFKAAATEIYSAYANADFVLRQAFAQTATGEYLDMHAQLRGIERKQSARAHGALTFFVSEPLEEQIIIPAGTICSNEGNPQIQFETDAQATLPAGELSCTVAATAVTHGREFNLSQGEVTVMVNPPEYIEGVINDTAFTGGCDDESDSSLRERIISSYSVTSNAVNKKSAEELVMTLNEVSDCNISLDESSALTVCVKTADDNVSQELCDEITNLLGFAALCGVEINAVPASKVDFSIRAAVKIKRGYNREALEAELLEKIREACSQEKIGKSIKASEITPALYGTQGAELIELALSPGAEGVAACGAREYLVLTDARVDFYE